MPERDDLDAKAASQFGLVAEIFRRERGVEIGYTSQFAYEIGAILIRDGYRDQVLAILGQREGNGGPETAPGDTGGPPAGGPPAGGQAAGGQAAGQAGQPPSAGRVSKDVVVLSLRDTAFAFGASGTLAALDEIDRVLGEGIATPNHLLTVAQVSQPAVVHICPATDPEEVPEGIEPDPGPCARDDGKGVRIYIADTGLLEYAAERHAWLHGVHGDLDPLPDPAQIGPYTGHGTFVAGVARCMAPGADIYVGSVFDTGGSALESDAVPKLTAALDYGIDIFHLSIATATRKSLPLLSFDAWRQQVRDQKGVVCVVAAGNSSSGKPFWPAAFPEMVSVGALGADRRNRASFSNYGGWVDVYAPGRGLVNAYADGGYTCHDIPYAGQHRDFYGMARWSGTSFSSPIVTGLIAARMYRTGENGIEAAAALLDIARAQAIPGVGAILRPCLDDNAPRCGHGSGCGDRHGRGHGHGCGSGCCCGG